MYPDLDRRSTGSCKSWERARTLQAGAVVVPCRLGLRVGLMLNATTAADTVDSETTENHVDLAILSSFWPLFQQGMHRPKASKPIVQQYSVYHKPERGPFARFDRYAHHTLLRHHKPRSTS